MKIFLITIVFLFFSVLLFADAGNCILYKAEFKLKNGHSVIGFVRYNTLDSLKLKFTDKTFKVFIDELFELSDDTILVFLKIQSLQYPKMGTGEEEALFPAVLETDILKLTQKDISSSHFMDYLPHFDKKITEKPLYLDCGANSIITELTQNEINLLQKPPLVYFYYTAYQMLSYNPEITKNDLILFGERFDKLESIGKNCKEPNSAICYLREYAAIKKELSEKKVVVFQY